MEKYLSGYYTGWGKNSSEGDHGLDHLHGQNERSQGEEERLEGHNYG